MNKVTLKDMKYADLQKLAKKCGIKANMKCDKLRKALELFYEVEDTPDENVPTTEKRSVSVYTAAKTPVVPNLDLKKFKERLSQVSKNSLGSAHKKPTNFSVNKDVKTPVSVNVSKGGEGERKTPAVKPEQHSRKGTYDKNTPVVSGKPQAKKDDTPASIVNNKTHARKGTYDKDTPNAPQQNGGKHARKGTYDKDTPANAPNSAKHSRKGTYEKGTPAASQQQNTNKHSRKGTYEKAIKSNTPVATPSEPNRNHARKGTYDKKETPVSSSVQSNESSKISKGTKVSSQGRKSNEAKKMKMSDYISEDEDEVHPEVHPDMADLISDDEGETGSPGVHEMISGMTKDMTDDQMKAYLMEELDKRAKKKTVPVTADGVSHIPRYTALASPKNNGRKQPTPGNKLKNLHEKEFNKMESIDAYLERKRKRTESLTTSMKKMKVMTEHVRNVVESVKKYRTPPSLLKGNPVPAANKSRAALFQSPSSKQYFKPTVTSTSKANFNFSALKLPSSFKPNVTSSATKPGFNALKSPAPTKPGFNGMKSPAARKPFVPTVTSTSKANFNFGAARKSPRLSSGKVSKENQADPSTKKANDSLMNKSANTTFKFTGGMNKSHLMNKSQNTSLNPKPKFDLKASLSKPLSWKPYTGKLNSFKNGSNFNQNRSTVAKTKEQSKRDREQSRRAVQSKQADRRLDVQMKRRGMV